MPRILISYRRADSDAIAGRIRDQLAAQYRSDSVFMDIDSVPVGVDFREQIKSEIDKDDLVLAIIGPRWRGPRRGGRTRINDPDDFVRVELETALGRSIPVIPVLVDGMKMPKPEDLPDSLKKLSFHNAAVVNTGQDFHQHVDRLVRSMDRMLGVRRNLRKWVAVGVGAIAAIVVGCATWFFLPQLRNVFFQSHPNIDEVYNQSAGIILQNIVRAAHSVPMDFSQMFGSGSQTRSPNSQQELAIRQIVDLQTVDFFIREGYSRELLFWTVVGSVRETAAGSTIEFVNDTNPNLACKTINVQRCFRDMVDVAIASGLTVETRTAVSGRTAARLCFDQVLADRANNEYSPHIRTFLLSNESRPRCKIDPWPDTSTDILLFAFAGTPQGTVTYELIPRSASGILQFLANILAVHQEDTFRMRGALYPPQDHRIFAVERDRSIQPCYCTATFRDEYYCIPLMGAEDTRRIFVLLLHLLRAHS